MYRKRLKISLCTGMLILAVLWGRPAAAESTAAEGVLLPQVFKDLQELCVSYLRPGQIKERLDRASVIYIPVGPVEWHGLHMPLGTDPLIAQTVALASCRISGGVVWPTLSFGAASLRNPEQAEKLFGFEQSGWVWSVDFPENILPSAFCSAEILALIVRESIREASAMGARLVVLLSGHAAGGHVAALQRVAKEVAADTGLKVYFRGAWEKEPLYPEKDGHACSGETSIMMAQTKSVDLAQLPSLPTKLKYTETGIVDDWQGSGKTNYTVADKADPRRTASAEYGKAAIDHTVKEVAEEVKKLLTQLP